MAVIVCNIVSLDGYYAGPGDNVMDLPMDRAFDAYNLERMEAADTVLLGRRSYEGFGSYWPHIADAPEDPDNPALDATNRAISRVYKGRRKVVVSDSYTVPADHPWHDTTTVVTRADLAGWLADNPSEIVMYGSHVLWNAMLAAGLVDELHLMVGNAVLAGGTPLFTTPARGLRLLDARRFDGSDNVVLRYAAR